MSIDFGVYGEDVFILDLGNDYGFFCGILVVMLQVVGVIVLLYVVFCDDFLDIVENVFVVVVFEVK